MPTDNGLGPATRPARPRLHPDELLPDLSTYEQLIDAGVAAADSQGSPVDHVTARRLAIWLTARPQHPDFTRALARFINTGAISQELRTHLRTHARTAGYSDHSQAARLLRYCASRADPGPVGEHFGRACHQFDRADLMLQDLRDRARRGIPPPRQAWPDTGGPPVIAVARRDPATQTLTLVLDAATASAAIFAITAHADEREAHTREVRQFGQALPDGSYGQQNRQAIAARETRITTRLRAIEHAYRTATDPDATPRLPELTGEWHPPQPAADPEFELE